MPTSLDLPPEVTSLIFYELGLGEIDAEYEETDDEESDNDQEHRDSDDEDVDTDEEDHDIVDGDHDIVEEDFSTGNEGLDTSNEDVDTKSEDFYTDGEDLDTFNRHPTVVAVKSARAVCRRFRDEIDGVMERHTNLIIRSSGRLMRIERMYDPFSRHCNHFTFRMRPGIFKLVLGDDVVDTVDWYEQSKNRAQWPDFNCGNLAIRATFSHKCPENCLCRRFLMFSWFSGGGLDSFLKRRDLEIVWPFDPNNEKGSHNEPESVDHFWSMMNYQWPSTCFSHIRFGLDQQDSAVASNCIRARPWPMPPRSAKHQYRDRAQMKADSDAHNARVEVMWRCRRMYRAEWADHYNRAGRSLTRLWKESQYLQEMMTLMEKEDQHYQDMIDRAEQPDQRILDQDPMDLTRQSDIDEQRMVELKEQEDLYLQKLVEKIEQWDQFLHDDKMAEQKRMREAHRLEAEVGALDT